MIHYSLICDKSHKFDGWFADAGAYDAQHARGLVTCPICLTTAVEKAIMAPAVNRSGSGKIAVSIGHPDQAKLREAMLALRNKVISEADYVGDKFAEPAFRSIGWNGRATREEIAALVEEGVDVLPLPGVKEEHN